MDVIGNIQADWRGGINNSFRYKNFTLSALLDAQMGGSFYSLDTKYGYYTGVYDFQAGVNSDGVNVRESVLAGGGLSYQELQDLGLPVEIPLLWDGTYDADGNMVGITETSLRTNNTNYATGYGYYAPNEGHVYDASR